MISEIRELLHDIIKSEEKRFVPPHVSDLVFTSFFEVREWSPEDANSLIERMATLDRPQLPLIEAFQQNKTAEYSSKETTDD